MNNLRVGIAGLGTASSQILPFFGKLPSITLGGAADVRPEAREKFTQKYDAPAFDSVEAICKSDSIDAVWIATPNELHAEHTILAARHGKHVICEKPMAVTLEQCDSMIKAADDNGVRLVQGHSKVYNAPIRKLREIIRSGVLGRVTHIDTWNYNDWLQRPRLADEVDTAKGGGIVYRQGPHQVDIVRYLGGGRVHSVRAVTGRHDRNFDTEGNYSAFLEFENGVSATLVLDGYGFFDVTDLTWGIGESGKMKAAKTDAAKPRITQTLSAAEKYALPVGHGGADDRPFQPFFGLTVITCEKGVLRQSPRGIFLYDADGCREIDCNKGNGRGDELLELLNAIRENRPAFPDGRWGKASLEVCIAMMQSSKERRDVLLKYQTDSPSHMPQESATA
jgi:phthalate 4,5-cis-dihydrodiol dehydrogenase